MKHASSTTIESLAPLLQKLRLLPELKEKKPGVFYRKSRAFLHFHEDDGRIYADVRLDGSDFQRLPCSSARDQAALITTIRSRVL